MADPSMIKQWYEFRRTLAWTAVSLWMLFAAAPMTSLAIIWLRGRPFVVGPAEIALRVAVPAALFTIGAFHAINILCTTNPDRSRAHAWRLAASFVAGLLAFLAAAYAYGR